MFLRRERERESSITETNYLCSTKQNANQRILNGSVSQTIFVLHRTKRERGTFIKKNNYDAKNSMFYNHVKHESMLDCMSYLQARTFELNLQFNIHITTVVPASWLGCHGRKHKPCARKVFPHWSNVFYQIYSITVLLNTL